jgi:antitoxin VapB
MPLTILDDTVDQLADKLAALKQVSKIEAVRIALENELRLLTPVVQPVHDPRPLRERIRHIQDRVASWESTGLEADKAFYDELSGDI